MYRHMGAPAMENVPRTTDQTRCRQQCMCLCPHLGGRLLLLGLLVLLWLHLPGGFSLGRHLTTRSWLRRWTRS